MLLFQRLYHLFFAHICPCCHAPLFDEMPFCANCLASFRVLHNVGPLNPAERRVFGRMPFVHGASFCYYQRDEPFAKLIKAAKYHGQPQVNRALTQLFLSDLDQGGWPFDITLILPIPIHWRRRFTRGYNQVEPIARALGEHWHIPVDTHNLYKRHYTTSQVKQANREANQQRHHPFAVRHPERLQGQHVLIVDDVLTSGATIRACAKVLYNIPGLRLSFLTLGVTREPYGFRRF
jgi:ComF family protein